MFLFMVLFLTSGVFSVLFGQALTGDKIIKATGGDYSSLGAAITALNTNGVSGTVRFLIDENLNESGADLIITRNDLSAVNNLVIKPNAGKTPTISIATFPTTGASPLNGITIINASFITIDGSNTVNGTSRDLTISGNDAAGLYLIGVIDNADDITIKNVSLQIQTMAAGSTGIGCDGVTGVPDRLLIQNCLIGTPTVTFRTGVGLYGNAASTLINANVYDCEIYAKRRGITTFYNVKNIYRGNTISIVTPDANQTFYAGIYLTGFPAGDTTIIENNKIIKLSSNPTSTVRFAGGIVIYGNEGVFNIQNNFISSNYTNASATLTEKVYGIIFGSVGWSGTANIAFNTIDLSATNQTGRTACIGWEINSSSTVNVHNNIMVNRNNTALTYGIHWSNTASATSVLNSNHNNIVLGGSTANFGLYGATTYPTLADWQTGTTLDVNTKTKAVTFVSTTNLHLSGSSQGDADLKGTPISGITTDIDGETRNATAPYKGADEYIAGVVPVELVLFTCEVNGSNNILNWRTATETNNYGFEVERLNNVNWEKIGFIKGNGTSAIGCDYRFTDEQMSVGNVQYRLKQIDFNGNYTYSSTVEANRSGIVSFNLAQNFPNPFNPSTEIRYTLPFAGNVTVIVYNAVGEMVKLLDSGIKESGSYTLHFNGSELASGMYMYSINAVSFDGQQNLKATKKMLLIK